jgi:hypothetical protein
MKRRELLQSLTALTASPFLLSDRADEPQIADVVVLSGPKYVVFYDPDVLDPADVKSSVNYLADAALFPIHLKTGQSFDDAVRIYKMEDVNECPA